MPATKNSADFITLEPVRHAPFTTLLLLIAALGVSACSSEGTGGAATTNDTASSNPALGAASPDEEFLSGQRHVTDVMAYLKANSQDEPADLSEVELHWGDYGPFDNLAATADDTYTGSREPAEMTLPLAGRVFDALLFGGDSTNAPYRRRQFMEDAPLAHFRQLPMIRRAAARLALDVADGDLLVNPCLDEQTLTRVDTLSMPAETRWHALMRMEMNGCVLVDHSGMDGDKFVSGVLWVLVADDDATAERDHYFAYDNLYFETGVDIVSVNGAEHWKAPLFSRTPQLTSTLVFESLGQQAFYRQFARSSSLERTFTDSTSSLTWSRFDGAVLLSDYGEVTVSTPAELRFLAYDGSLLDRTHEENLLAGDGELIVRGADGAQVAYQTVAVDNSDYVSEHDRFVPTLSADNAADDDAPVVYRFHLEEAKDGVLLDLRDADGDGMRDSWEERYGLNPDDPQDALLDLDGDGVSNIDEYRYLSQPDDAGESGGLRSELDVSASIDFSAYRRGIESSLSTSVSVVMSERRDNEQHYTFSVMLSSGLQWDQSRLASGCQVSETNPARLDCVYTHGDTFSRSLESSREQVFESVPLHFVVPSDYDDTVRVTASMAVEAYELSSDNNTTTDTIDLRESAPLDLAIEAPAMVLGNPDTVNTVVADINVLSRVPGSALEVSIDVPDGVAIQSAELVSSGLQDLISRCHVSSGVFCTLEDVQPDDEVTLTLELTVQQLGSHELQWRVEGSMTDPDVSNNATVTTLRFMQSMAVLNALIDAASDGDTVQLPPGEFVGTITGILSEDLTVQGATGDEPTVLVSIDSEEPLITWTGRRGTWRNLEFRTNGGPVFGVIRENATIEDSLFVPAKSVSHDLDGIFATGPGASIRLLGNRFEGFGVGEGNRCTSLLNLESRQSGYTLMVYLQHNTFFNNHCDAVIRGRVNNLSYASFGQLIVSNNTFAANPSLFQFTGEEGSPRVRIENNLIVGAESLVTVDPALFTDRVYNGAGLSSSRNLVWDSERGSFLTSALVNRRGIDLERTDLHVNPRLVDVDGGDLRLRASSPAIDAGVERFPYRWTLSNIAYEGLQPAPEATPPALDGNADGLEQIDIGAHEF